jgi:hypothetical protein
MTDTVRRTVRLLALLIAAAMPPARAEVPSLAELLKNTAVTPPATVAFREERHNPLLKEPLVLSGHFAYLAAGRMAKSIDTPFVESYIVADDKILIERDGRTRSLSLNRSRSLRSIFTALEAILAGRAETLDELFSHKVSGTREAWVVELTPLSKKLARQLEGMRIDGNESRVTSIRVDLADDEWQRMDFLEQAPGS